MPYNMTTNATLFDDSSYSRAQKLSGRVGDEAAAAAASNASISPNPLLFKLEDKPKPVLSHELGAGSPCLKCGKECAGLDLHFWRKICKNCSCRLDEHDIILSRELDHGEFVIRKLFDACHNGSRYTREPTPNRHLTTFEAEGINRSAGNLLDSENEVQNGIVKKLQRIHLNAAEKASAKNVINYNLPLQNSNSISLNLTAEKFKINDSNRKVNRIDNNNIDYDRNGSLTEKDQCSTGDSDHASPVSNVQTLRAQFSSPGSSNNYGGFKPSITPHNHINEKSNNKSKTNIGSEYSWMPAGEHILVEKYMQSLPETERPIVSTCGAQLRRQRLAYQLPYHDCDTEAAKSLRNDDERQMHRSFVDFVKQNAVGIGELVDSNEMRRKVSAQDISAQLKHPCANNGQEFHIKEAVTNCKNCTKNLFFNDVGIVTEHGAPNEIWHPECFRCGICHQLLADLLYFFKDGQYFCGRHYGERIYPRCGGCDELIFAKEYTFAEEKSWHVDHFCCFGCDLHLGGHRYITKQEQTYCIDCYMLKFARTCLSCNNKIAPFDKRIQHKDFHWHANDKCFKCQTCGKALVNQKFSLKEDNIFCSANCSKKFAPKH